MAAMGEHEVTVLVVDDQPPFRKAARAVVAATPGFEVLDEARSGEDAVEMTERLKPDLVLMDINLGGMSGIEATRRIARSRPSTVIVLISTYQASDLPADATDCGAAAYLNKEDVGPAELRRIWDRARSEA